jgi:transcriptional regulator with XRE-family HTH domain
MNRPQNRTAIREGERALRRQSTRAAEELRVLRLRSGVSQAAIADSIGVSRYSISKLEQGHPGIAIRTRFRVAAVLGADLRLTAFEGSSALIRDARQAAIINALLHARDPLWRPTVEAAVPGPGRRSVDLRLESPAHIVLIEVETRLTSLEEIIRELHAKRQAFQDASPAGVTKPIHLVLALPATRHHRTLVRDHPDLIRAAFPTPSIEVSRALADSSRPWPGDGLLWIRRL